MVISQKMIEKEMGYRGSKSITDQLREHYSRGGSSIRRMLDLHKPASHKSVIVKEQRVDGSWCGVYTPRLRCTLTDFERNYQVKIPSNQINKSRSYSSIAIQQCSTQNLTMDP